MKKLKSFLSGFIAAATVITSVGFTASAYDVCDINQDGKVDTRDVSAISRYLAGNVKVSDYSKLDVNKSLIVDYMDEQCVLAKVMGWSYSSSYYSKKNKTSSTAASVSTITLNKDADSKEARKYRQYSYISQKEMSSYTLDLPTSSINSSSAEERAIIGTDDRYASTGSENSGIVYLKDIGTGFIVGDHYIATAAHCVYDRSTDNWYSSMRVMPYQYDGNVSATEFTPVEVHIPALYTNKNYSNVNEKYKYDYALITVKEDLSGYVHFNLGEAYSVNEVNYSNIPIYVTGNPDKTPSDDYNVTGRLYTGEGRVISKYSQGINPTYTTTVKNTELLHYNADTQSGNSGGPVYTVTKNVVNNKASYTYTAIAIHDYGLSIEEDGPGLENGGTLITKYLIQFYKNNNYANY